MKWCLKFVEETDKDGIKSYNVINHKDDWLGMIEYNKRWKLWVFMPDMDTIYSAGCIEVIMKKLRELDEQKN